MNSLLVVTVCCAAALTVRGAPLGEETIRDRRAVPETSYFRVKEGVKVVIPGLETTTDIISTTYSPDEGVTDLGHLGDYNKNTVDGLTPQKGVSNKPNESVKQPSSSKPSSSTAPNVAAPQPSPTPSKPLSPVSPPSTAPREPNAPNSQTSTEANQGGQNYLTKLGPVELPIPIPLPGGNLRLKPKIPSVPNFFG